MGNLGWILFGATFGIFFGVSTAVVRYFINKRGKNDFPITASDAFDV